MLEASLHSLEQAALTARSGTSDESQLRRNEADLILQWIDRARKVEPLGQVVIGQAPRATTCCWKTATNCTCRRATGSCW
jgi:hypothetical protein